MLPATDQSDQPADSAVSARQRRRRSLDRRRAAASARPTGSTTRPSRPPRRRASRRRPGRAAGSTGSADTATPLIRVAAGARAGRAGLHRHRRLLGRRLPDPPRQRQRLPARRRVGDAITTSARSSPGWSRSSTTQNKPKKGGTVKIPTVAGAPKAATASPSAAAEIPHSPLPETPSPARRPGTAERGQVDRRSW